MNTKSWVVLNHDMFTNMNPNDLPLWPALFITTLVVQSLAHATQSLMARVVWKNEKNGRFVFYGNDWWRHHRSYSGALALSFFGSVEFASLAVAKWYPCNVAYSASFGLLVFGGILAFLGVVIPPITSGDTAFRSSRLILAEYFNMNRRYCATASLMALPLFCYRWHPDSSWFRHHLALPAFGVERIVNSNDVVDSFSLPTSSQWTALGNNGSSYLHDVQKRIRSISWTTANLVSPTNANLNYRWCD